MVLAALKEDVGTGDITAAIIPEDHRSHAVIITRNEGRFCGIPWGDATVTAVDSRIRVDWHVEDGDRVVPGQRIAGLVGLTRSLVTAERTLLNFLQLLSGTASTAARAAHEVEHTHMQVLDTRKTIPGLRAAQKYAVACGGASNHRHGLFDAVLLKENHLKAAGGIRSAASRAKLLHPGKMLEVEVEDLAQLQEAITAKVDRVLLDNFDLPGLRAAVALAGGRVKLEASGGWSLRDLREVAATGVDCISMGSLTKAIVPMDLSMRILPDVEE